MSKIKLRLRELSVTQKIQSARQIIASLAGNTDFTQPIPVPDTITAAINDLETAFNDTAAKRMAAQQATLGLGLKEQALDALLTQLAGYIEAASGGDESKILGAGMQVRGAAAAVGPLDHPGNLSASSGDMDGSIDLHWDPVSGARSYVTQQTQNVNDAASWQSTGVVTRSLLPVSGLVSGQRYWFRVAAGERRDRGRGVMR